MSVTEAPEGESLGVAEDTQPCDTGLVTFHEPRDTDDQVSAVVPSLDGTAIEATESSVREMDAHIDSDDCSSQGDDEDQINPYSTLGKISLEFLDIMSELNDPLSPEERKCKPLPNEPDDYRDVVRKFLDLVTYDEDSPPSPHTIDTGGTLGRIVLSSHTVAAALSTLHPLHLRRLATRLLSDVTLWLTRLWCMPDSGVFASDDPREGLLRVGRMLLYHAYPEYTVEGHAALYARPPRVYLSSITSKAVYLHLVQSLGLGTSSLRMVPCITRLGTPSHMDPAALQRLIQEDVDLQRMPLLVIAHVGSGLLGGSDALGEIRATCVKHGAWLHVEGPHVGGAALMRGGATGADTTTVADSMSLNLGPWLGIPSLPHATVFRVTSHDAVYTAGLTSVNVDTRVDSVQLWLTLKCLGLKGIKTRLFLAFQLAGRLRAFLAAQPIIRLLSPCPAEATPPLEELLATPHPPHVVVEAVCSTVVFQYCPVDKRDQPNGEYCDNLNNWLAQVVRRGAPALSALTTIHTPGSGLALRWAGAGGWEAAEIEEALAVLQEQISIIESTVEKFAEFQRLVDQDKNLQVVRIPQWAGLGGVRYVPDDWLAVFPTPSADTIVPERSEQQVHDFHRLTNELVDHLRVSDSAFSIGYGEDSLPCVQFGMVTDNTDLAELLGLVLEAGVKVEDGFKALERMSKVVVKGIETATQALQQESEDKLWQEGLLRHVPIVGPMYNWLLPVSKEGVRGRALKIEAAVVESTENTYKYHMQMQDGAIPANPDQKLPPAPLIQTPVAPPTPTHAAAPPQATTSTSNHSGSRAPSQSEVDVDATNGV